MPSGEDKPKNKGGRGKLGTLQVKCGNIFVDYELLRKNNRMEAQFHSNDIVRGYEALTESS